jgi:N-acetylglutamate synthase-like GNAT family acetyltransferase
MEVIIEPIANEYQNEIIDIILPIQQKEFNVPVTLEDQPDLLNIKDFYYKSGGMFLGAKVNGILVGTIALIKFDNNAGAIRKMFVKKEFRGKELKIAQQLLDTLISYCKKNEIDHLYLGTVNLLKAAIRFYEKNNFIQIDKNELPVKFPLMSADNVFCYLSLK